MSIYQIVYVSTAKKQLSSAELDQLTSCIAKNNANNELTGILLYTGTSFLQLLEGCTQKVKEIFQVIQKDPRHTSLSVIVERTIKTRRYPRTSLSFRVTDQATLEALYTLFLQSTDEAIKKSFQSVSLRAKRGNLVSLNVAGLLRYRSQRQ